MSKKILVVDDDEGILDALSLILSEAGYTVKTLIKGDEVFTKLTKFHPDIILLDVLMSGKDGRDICKILKANQKTKQIPIIMISAHPSAQEGAVKFGADDFLAKPFDTKDLFKKIKKFIK